MSRGYSVYARKDRPRFYICFLSPETGDWKDEVTPYAITDPQGRAKALRLAEQKSAEFQRTRTGRAREHWAAWVPKFLRDNYRGNTFTRYDDAWDKLRAFLTERKVHTPALCTYQHAQDYVDWRTKQKRNAGALISRNTALFEIKLLRVLLHEAVKRGFCLGNPLTKIGIRRDRPREKAALTAADIAKHREGLRTVEGHLPITQRWMTVSFEIALHQGCRLMETAVPMTDVDLERETITFRAKASNGRQNVFTTRLHPALVPLMRELEQAGATHTLHWPAKTKPSVVWWKFRKRFSLLHVCFHSTRVTVITQLARSGVPISQAMRFVGHASREIHRTYQKLAAEDLSGVTEALNFDAPKPGNPRGS